VVVLDGVRRAPHRKRGQSRRINVCEDVWPEHSRFGTDGLSTPLDDGTRPGSRGASPSPSVTSRRRFPSRVYSRNPRNDAGTLR